MMFKRIVVSYKAVKGVGIALWFALPVMKPNTIVVVLYQNNKTERGWSEEVQITSTFSSALKQLETDKSHSGNSRSNNENIEVSKER
jgi:hypothetical protein